MNIRIASHLRGEEQKKFVELWNSQTMIRERLLQLITEKIIAADKERVSTDAFSSPSWAYKQADTNGYIRALQELQQLIQGERTNNV